MKDDSLLDGFKQVKNLGQRETGGQSAKNGARKGSNGGSAPKIDDPKYETGTDIVKEFRDRHYAGKITSYSEGQYHVIYKDGDEKDLDEAKGGTRNFDAQKANEELEKRIKEAEEKEAKKNEDGGVDAMDVDGEKGDGESATVVDGESAGANSAGISEGDRASVDGGGTGVGVVGC